MCLHINPVIAQNLILSCVVCAVIYLTSNWLTSLQTAKTFKHSHIDVILSAFIVDILGFGYCKEVRLLH